MINANNEYYQNGSINIRKDNDEWQTATDTCSESGSSAVLIEKSITENGNYSAKDDNADGYSDVTVDVASSFTKSVVSFAFVNTIDGQDTVRECKSEIIITSSTAVSVPAVNQSNNPIMYTTIIGDISTLYITQSEQTHGSSCVTFKARSNFSFYIDGVKKNIGTVLAGEVYTITTWWEYVGPVYKNMIKMAKWDDPSSFVYEIT